MKLQNISKERFTLSKLEQNRQFRRNRKQYNKTIQQNKTKKRYLEGCACAGAALKNGKSKNKPIRQRMKRNLNFCYIN